MACPKSADVEAYIDGMLHADEQARFESHLATCKDCRDAIIKCGHDHELSQDIRQVFETLSIPNPDSTQTIPGKKSKVNESIEGYEILHEIHRGGQGIVYKAVQLATKRMVALKVLLHGPYATASQQHRFEREIDLVASLRHPNIVTVYDSGLTQGHHYFAMEFVHGWTLDVYMAKAKPDTKSTLRLFQKICQAVNAAHQRGVIHRDLKPGNIRVDPEGEPHILDFGLAKMAGNELKNGVPVTIPGEFMGTLAYASPEQASGDSTYIDIRTDVYSLGVILFEMLTGEYPYSVNGILSDVLRNIIEAEPKRPSTISNRVNDEIETIVLHALAKEKERRYQSAEALSRDVGRYLSGEPLDARRDSTWYILRKTMRRYYVAVTIAVAFLLILSGSTIALSILYRNQAEARAEAQKRADELEVVTQFQKSMLEDIDAQQMGRALFADLRSGVLQSLETDGVPPEKSEAILKEFEQTLRRNNPTNVALKLVDEQMLAHAVQAIDTDFANQPLVRAALQQTVADTYCQIGRYPPAMPLQKAALEIRRTMLGEDHPDTLHSMNSFGYLLEMMGKYEEAQACYQKALDGSRRVYGKDHPQMYRAVNNLGLLLSNMGKHEEARILLEEALEGRRLLLGENHPDTLNSILNMGGLLESVDKRDEALEYYLKALEGNRRVYGKDNPETLITMNNLGRLLQSMDRLEEALKYHREALAGWRRTKGDDHRDTLVSMTNTGSLLMSMGQFEEALDLFLEAVERSRHVLGDDHPNTLLSISYTGVLLQRMGRLEEAEPYFRESLENNRRVLGEDHPNTIIAIHNMGKLLSNLGKLEEAEALGARAVRWARENSPEGDPSIAAYLLGYGTTLCKLERYSDAEPLLLEAQMTIEAARGPNHRFTFKTIQSLVDLYEAWNIAEPDSGYDEKTSAWKARLQNPTEGSDQRQESHVPKGAKQ